LTENVGEEDINLHSMAEITLILSAFGSSVVGLD